MGLHHEQQHQELLLTDIKYNFGNNLLCPPLIDSPDPAANTRFRRERWAFNEYESGLTEIGALAGFCFDNELPRHRVYLAPFSLANRLVTNEEYLAFMEDGGYHRPELWLSEGWSQRQQQAWNHPLYWHWRDGAWWEYRFDGLQPLVSNAPVVHVSGYESAAALLLGRMPGFQLNLSGSSRQVLNRS